MEMWEFCAGCELLERMGGEAGFGLDGMWEV